VQVSEDRTVNGRIADMREKVDHGGHAAILKRFEYEWAVREPPPDGTAPSRRTEETNDPVAEHNGHGLLSGVVAVKR